MSVLVVGMSHRTAPVAMLERASVPAAETRKVLDELLECADVSEALLVSTCNRVEVYAVVATFHGGLADISRVLARQADATLDELTAHLYVHYAAAGAEHVFRVAAGLDSMVVGEPQILGQLRDSYAAAEQAGTVGRTLHELTQHALRAGKRVRADTGIDGAGASVVAELLARASTMLNRDGQPGLAGSRALVIGSGSMGALAAAQLRRARVGELVLANRSPAAAHRLAETSRQEGTPARAVELDGLDAALRDVDLVVSCTGATDTVLDAEQVTRARAAARGALVVCDLGLPHDVDAGVGRLAGVTVLDLATLAQQLETTATDTGAAAELVAEQVQAYLAAQRSAEVTPTVAALRKRAAETVDAELLRLDGKLPELDQEVRDELRHTVRRVVDKLLHTPTVRVKQLAEDDGGHAYADALRVLFELDPQAPAAVTATVHRSRGDEREGSG